MFQFVIFASFVALALTLPYDPFNSYQTQTEIYSPGSPLDLSGQNFQYPLSSSGSVYDSFNSFRRPFDSSGGSLGYSNGNLGSSVGPVGSTNYFGDPINSLNGQLGYSSGYLGNPGGAFQSSSSLYGGANSLSGPLGQTSGNFGSSPGSLGSSNFLGGQFGSSSGSLGYSNTPLGSSVGPFGSSNTFGGAVDPLSGSLAYSGGSLGSPIGAFGSSNSFNGQISPPSGSQGYSSSFGYPSFPNSPFNPSTGSYGNSIGTFGSSQGSYGSSNNLHNPFGSTSGSYDPSGVSQGSSSLFFSGTPYGQPFKDNQYGSVGVGGSNALDFDDDDQDLRKGRGLSTGTYGSTDQEESFKSSSLDDYGSQDPIADKTDFKPSSSRSLQSSPFTITPARKAKSEPSNGNPLFDYIKGGSFHR